MILLVIEDGPRPSPRIGGNFFRWLAESCSKYIFTLCVNYKNIFYYGYDG